MLILPTYLSFGPLPAAIVVIFSLVSHLFYRRQKDKAANSDTQASAKLTYAALEKSEKQYRETFEFSAPGIALVSPTYQVLRINRSLAKMLGGNGESFVDTNLFSMITQPEADSVRLGLSQLIDGIHQNVRVEAQVLRRNRNRRWMALDLSLIRDAKSRPDFFVVHFDDVTDRRILDDERHRSDRFDNLTDLPNRTLFLDQLQQAVNRSRREIDTPLSVLNIDIDRFKQVNDRYGPSVGDKILAQVARRLEPVLGKNSSRLGVDEFAAMIEGNTFEQTLAKVAEIRKELSKPYMIDGETVFATVSIGIAICHSGYDSAEILIRDAHTALSQAKKTGRDRFEIFVDGMHSSSVKAFQMENDLRNALERNELKIHYQPIVALDTGVLSGFESLLRWEHPTQGFISPADFVPVAEETGLIVPIGEWILRESCRQIGSWQQKSDRAKNLWISVNVSSKQFLDIDLVSLVSSVLEETGVEPSSLKLEMTESTMVQNVDYVASVMKDLKQTGVKFSVDDFGTGFSSLSTLHSFPLDSLKIDRSFVSQIKAADRPVEIIRTIVTLAQSLNLEIIAEGVETIEQLTQLRQLGCEFGQGYCFATPLEASALDELLGSSGSSSKLYYLLPADPRRSEKSNPTYAGIGVESSDIIRFP